MAAETIDVLISIQAKADMPGPERALWLEAKAEIERLRLRLAKIEHAPVDPNNKVAMALKGWASPRDGEPENIIATRLA